MVVSKDQNCDCRFGWVEHVKAAGFEVRVVEMTDLSALKARLSIPPDLSACHSAEIEGYVIEGHVPASVSKYPPAEPGALGCEPLEAVANEYLQMFSNPVANTGGNRVVARNRRGQRTFRLSADSLPRLLTISYSIV
jgi:hypothetical protein